MLRERKKLNQSGSILGTLALIGGAAALIVAVTPKNSVLYNGLRFIFLLLDSAVYTIAGWAYSIFYEVSYNSILSSLNLSTAAQRLYTLLGIFMLFRLAFAFVKYIINPDGMEKGSGKLMTNLAVSLALIVSTPWIFNRAFELQTYIMDSNVIGNLIMGMNTNTAEDDNFNAGSYGQVISFLTFGAFYHPESSIPAISSCGNLLNYYSEYVEISTEDGRDILVVPDSTPQEYRKDAEKIAACVNELNGRGDTADSTLAGNSVEIGTRFFIASQRYNMGLITHSGVYEATIGETHVISYTPIVSTIAGGFLALLFLNFCFDVAIRNVKLCFLQIIAPIPIILNIEPGDSKNKPLSWWGKECLRTYVDLFIRVATVYFGVFLINQLFGNGMTVQGSSNTSAWFKVFMILGILLFVKQVPEMIGKAFGIDMKGNFSLNPLKRIGDNKIASMALGGAAGLATGLVGGGIAGYMGARSNGAGVAQALRHAAGGALGGGAHSLESGARKGVKSLNDITSNATQNWARSGRIAQAAVGTNTGRIGSAISQAFGAKTAAQQMEDRAARLDNVSKSASNLKNALETSKDKFDAARSFGSGTKTFNSSAEISNYLRNNSYLNSEDQNALSDLAARMRKAEAAVEPVTVSIDGRDVSFKSYEEASDYFYNNDLSTVDSQKMSQVLSHFNSDEYRNAKSLLDSGSSLDLAGVQFTDMKAITDFANTLNASDVISADVKEAFGNFQKEASIAAFEKFKNDNTTSIGVAFTNLQNEYGNVARQDRASIPIVTDQNGNIVSGYDDLKKAIGDASVGASSIRSSAGYRQVQRNDAYVKSKQGGK